MSVSVLQEAQALIDVERTLQEIAKAPKRASRMYDKVLRRAKGAKGVKNPYAVAMGVVKTQYYKGKGGRWKRRKEPLKKPSQAPKYSKSSELYMAQEFEDPFGREAMQDAMEMKEQNAATSLAQLFRGQPISPEWAAWRMYRQQRAISAAQGLYEKTARYEYRPVHEQEPGAGGEPPANVGKANLTVFGDKKAYGKVQDVLHDIEPTGSKMALMTDKEGDTQVWFTNWADVQRFNMAARGKGWATRVDPLIHAVHLLWKVNGGDSEVGIAA